MRERGECGPSFAEGVPFGMGAVDALRWTRRYASFPLVRKNKVRPHSTRTHLPRAYCSRCTTTHSTARSVSHLTCACVPV